MTIEKSKTPEGISYLFGIALILGIMKPFVDVFALNAGAPIIGVFFGIVFTLLLCLIACFNRDFKLYQAEIYLYFFVAIYFLQIFNPDTSIERGASSFFSFCFLPMVVYLISSRVLQFEQDVRNVTNCLYWFSVVALFYGIYTSIVGTPSIFSFPSGEYFTGSGTLRVRSLTGSEQTYFTVIFFSLFMTYLQNKKKFYPLFFLFAIQMVLFFPKNPIAYALVSFVFCYFFAARYKTALLIFYYISMVLIFIYMIFLMQNDLNSISDSWLSLTPFGVESVLERYAFWLLNAVEIINNPFGFGPGSATKLALPADGVSGRMVISNGIIIIEPHNEYMRLALEASIIAPLLLLAFIDKTLLQLRVLISNNKKSYYKILAGLIFGFTFIAFFNNHMFGSEEKFILWFMVGIVFNKKLIRA